MASKYDIHPDFARFPVMNLSFNPIIVALLNSAMRFMGLFFKPGPGLTVSSHKIASADGSRFKIRIMRPRGLEANAPALLYYHGGAFALTYANLHLNSCARYAREAGCVVIFVDYRLGPKHPFPCGFEDSYAALEWTLNHASELGLDADRIAVGGDSAGGALAAGVAQKARDEHLLKLCAQLLIYPVLDDRCDTASASKFVDVPLWNANSNRRMWEMYLQRYAGAGTPAYAAPGTGQLQDLPLSYVETAEFDPLHDEGLIFADALEKADVDVVRNETRQTVHGYDSMEKSAITSTSMLQRIGFLQRAFARNTA